MTTDIYNRNWIIEKSLLIIPRYNDGILTLRGLHYKLLPYGMPNTFQHYKRVIAAMGVCRRDGRVRHAVFSDHEREMIGETNGDQTDLDDQIDLAKDMIDYYIKNYHLNYWDSQPILPEVWIEKKTLIGIFKPITQSHKVALAACKGYPSLTYLYEASLRFEDTIADGKKPVILYFGDYDPSGEDIPRSIYENLLEMGVDVEVRRIALLEHQVLKYDLPPAPSKTTDSRNKNWSGIGQVELDAFDVDELQNLIGDSIMKCFDYEIRNKVIATEEQQRKIYVKNLKKHVTDLKL